MLVISSLVLGGYLLFGCCEVGFTLPDTASVDVDLDGVGGV